MKKIIILISFLVGLLIVVGIVKQEQMPTKPSKSLLGIGLGLSPTTLTIAHELSEVDFVDNKATGREVRENIKELESYPVKTVCVSLNLTEMREKVSVLSDENVNCDYLGFNPEQRGKIPNSELEDLVSSVKSARDIAQGYGAQLLTGPGMKFMLSNEELYSAAKYSDVWIIQSQQFQIDNKTGVKAEPEEYSAEVGRVVDMLKSSNPEIIIWVQIMIEPGERDENEFSPDEIIALARSIEKDVDAIRINTQGISDDETIKEVIRLLRTP
ncbi:MAG: hypothetical protein ABII08_01655 [Candidatus Beckwithbacteria bacterium]|nr:hypothetical protein [Patescibacteria group bacterium]